MSARVPDPQMITAQWFATTHWSAVMNAKAGDEAQAAAALGQLCQTYWGPVNAYIRRLGHGPHDADDLTQQFFARFLEKEHYRLAKRERGRFRNFLLIAVKHFLVNEWERARAQKRGGGQLAMSLDEDGTESGLARIELRDERTAEHIYERNWALTLLTQVRDRLASEYAAEGKGERFTQLEKFLPGEESELTYAQVAAQFDIAEGTVKSDVHRLKRRYRELLREEIAHPVATPLEIEDELRHLMAVFSQGA